MHQTVENFTHHWIGDVLKQFQIILTRFEQNVGVLNLKFLQFCFIKSLIINLKT